MLTWVPDSLTEHAAIEAMEPSIRCNADIGWPIRDEYRFNGLTVLFQFVRGFTYPALICRAFLRKPVKNSSFCHFLAGPVPCKQLARILPLS